MNIPKLYNFIQTRGQCYKNTAVIYHGNFNPIFSRVKFNGKLLQYLSFPLWANVDKTFYHDNLQPFHSNNQGNVA
jgi:hypothetical protein